MKRLTVRSAVFVLALAALAAGCASKSEEQNLLEERARWNVIATDWTQSADHTVLLNTRLSGPPNSTLSTLTVRIVLQDASGAEVRELWHVYDLSDPDRLRSASAATFDVEDSGEE